MGGEARERVMDVDPRGFAVYTRLCDLRVFVVILLKGK
jgi:hypothetical protein